DASKHHERPPSLIPHGGRSGGGVHSSAPPDASIRSPVSHLLSSPARNATTSATSSGSATRPKGDSSATKPLMLPNQSLFMSVSTTPGATALTVIPRAPSCLAKVLVNASIAALDMLYPIRSA